VATAQRQLAEASAVAIVGAGPVGIELAGEICHAFPELPITLIGAEDRLLPGYARALDRRLQRDLARAGVALRLGRRAIDLPATVEPDGPATLKLDDGTALTDCLIFRTGGAQPNTEWLQERHDVMLERGRIVVGDRLEVEGLPGVFALGDAALTKDTTTISGIERQVPYLNKLLRRLARGEPLAKEPPYKAWASPVIVVPFGPRHGATQLPLSLVSGGWLTARLKGSHLFVDKIRRDLGLSADQERGRV
jgi:apoptosis-inducing factor 2